MTHALPVPVEVLKFSGLAEFDAIACETALIIRVSGPVWDDEGIDWLGPTMTRAKMTLRRRRFFAERQFTRCG